METTITIGEDGEVIIHNAKGENFSAMCVNVQPNQEVIFYINGKHYSISSDLLEKFLVESA